MQEEEEPLHVISILGFVFDDDKVLYLAKFNNSEVELLDIFELMLVDITAIMLCVRMLEDEIVCNYY